MHTLLLRLSGPMQSWGTVSRFTERDSGQEPSKSGVIGLLCAALGKPRFEEPSESQPWPALAELAALRMGVKVERAGSVGVDFQTAGGGRMGGKEYGVARVQGGLFGSVMSRRFFLQDASFLVGLESDDLSLLTTLHQALRSPVWQISLGRKSYVPGVPPFLADGITDCGLEEALLAYAVPGDHDAQMRLVIEQSDPYGAEPRVDVPMDFERRRFGRRYVRVQPCPPAL